MRDFEIQPELYKKLKKISQKDKLLCERIFKKIHEIINCYDPEAYKNLRHDMKDKKRVQVGHFVLVFRFNKSENLIIFDDFDHHDKIYQR